MSVDVRGSSTFPFRSYSGVKEATTKDTTQFVAVPFDVLLQYFYSAKLAASRQPVD